MQIQEVIEIINRMQADGVIERYAVGGAVGATFYLEPVATLDVDIFVAFKSEPEGLIADPRPIFDYLKAAGCAMDGEYMMISGWPVQFLPAATPLLEEGLREATALPVDGTPARVFSAEHLAAIALQTGRTKDKARLLQFIETGVLDMPRFQDIISRHGLTPAWKRFEQQFLGSAP